MAWYVAALVMETKVRGAAKNIVHVDYVLVRSTTSARAISKSRLLGRAAETEYMNRFARKVTVRFRGLKNVYPIAGAPSDGVELLFDEFVGMREREVGKLVSRDERQFAVFPSRGEVPSDGRPDVWVKELWDATQEYLTRQRMGPNASARRRRKRRET